MEKGGAPNKKIAVNGLARVLACVVKLEWSMRLKPPRSAERLLPHKVPSVQQRKGAGRRGLLGDVPHLKTSLHERAAR